MLSLDSFRRRNLAPSQPRRRSSPGSSRPSGRRRGVARRIVLESLEHRTLLATTIAVNTLADDPNGPIAGSTTLRDAINQADAGLDTQYTIDMTGLSGSITLVHALPVLNNTNGGGAGVEIDILGPGAGSLNVQRSTTEGTPDFSIFTVDSGTIASLSGLTIANGHDGGFINIFVFGPLNPPITGVIGGGIINAGTLIVSNCTIARNSVGDGDQAFTFGGGIYNTGALTVSNSTMTGNNATFAGGAIDNSQGTVTVVDSTLSGNSSGVGGGIENVAGATVTVANSTLTANTAGTNGGGITNVGVLTLTNSTLADNNAGSGGGGIFNTGTLNAGNTTITGNSVAAGGSGGGLNTSSGVATLDNAIVAANVVEATQGPSDDNIAGSVFNFQRV